MEELEGILRLLLGASVQVSSARQGRAGSSSGCRGGGVPSGASLIAPLLTLLQCEHRELFIRHIQGLSLEVQSELAAAIQEVP